MAYTAINLKEKLGKFSEQWSPRVVAQLNEHQLKIVKIQGDFVWHSHPETDEAFLILDGSMQIEFRDGKVDLKSGDLYIVPKGVEHKPFAQSECCILLIEPIGTLNTGDAGGERTAEQNMWI